MYKEKSFKRTILFLRIRRYIFIYFFVAVSLVGSWFAVRALIELLHYPDSIVPFAMVGIGVTVFFIAFILTSNLEFKVKQANLEIEIYNKLRLNTAMLTKLLNINGISLNHDNPLVESTDLVVSVPKSKASKVSKSVVPASPISKKITKTPKTKKLPEDTTN